jgi:hypothetical protein
MQEGERLGQQRKLIILFLEMQFVHDNEFSEIKKIIK